jgi:ATP-binding cassette subfamily B protein
VTHRLAHIIDYDLIYVMEKGRLAEVGSHSELLARNGLYAELWSKQSGFTIDETGTAEVELERLRKIPFLSASSDDLLRSFSSKLLTETFQKGRVVFEEGDAGDKFYILARGRMEAYAAGAEQARFVIDDGNYFGEVALIERIPRTLTLRALTECVCLTLNKKDFEALLALDADLKQSILDVSTARMTELKAAKVSAAEAL